MGQKVNPHGLRVGVIKNWDSRWFAKDKDFGDTLVEDYNLRKYLLKLLEPAGVPKIEIERDAKRVRIFIHCAKPGQSASASLSTAQSPVSLSAAAEQKSTSSKKFVRRSSAVRSSSTLLRSRTPT